MLRRRGCPVEKTARVPALGLAAALVWILVTVVASPGVAAPPEPGELKYSRKVALVVGANADLPYPASNAAAVAAVLAERFGFRVRLLVDAAPAAPLPPGVVWDHH